MNDTMLDIIHQKLGEAHVTYTVNRDRHPRVAERALGHIECLRSLLQQHHEILETWGSDVFYPGEFDRMTKLLDETRDWVPAVN